MIVPMVAGVLVVPDLIHLLGTDRFGVLSISWILVGYFGLLDMGLARGLTQYLAQQKSQGRNADECAFTAHCVRRWMLILGLIWAVILLALMPWATQTALKMPEALRRSWPGLDLFVTRRPAATLGCKQHWCDGGK